MILTFEASAMQTTAARASIATGTSIKTLLQIDPKITGKIVEWGISFDGYAAALPGKVELIETDVAATVTAYVAADITKVGPWVADAVVTTTYVTVGTANSGYNASGEGSITAVRDLNPAIFLPPTAPFVMQFPLGQEPVIVNGKFYRIRCTFGTSVNAYPYIKVDF